MKRKPVNRKRAARAFSKSRTRSKRINVAPPPMRGGFRI